jgi:hypothetical protein
VQTHGSPSLAVLFRHGPARRVLYGPRRLRPADGVGGDGGSGAASSGSTSLRGTDTARLLTLPLFHLCCRGIRKGLGRVPAPKRSWNSGTARSRLQLTSWRAFGYGLRASVRKPTQSCSKKKEGERHTKTRYLRAGTAEQRMSSSRRSGASPVPALRTPAVQAPHARDARIGTSRTGLGRSA